MLIKREKSGYPLYLSCAELVSVSHQVYSIYFNEFKTQTYSTAQKRMPLLSLTRACLWCVVSVFFKRYNQIMSLLGKMTT